MDFFIWIFWYVFFGMEFLVRIFWYGFVSMDFWYRFFGMDYLVYFFLCAFSTFTLVHLVLFSMGLVYEISYINIMV